MSRDGDVPCGGEGCPSGHHNERERTMTGYVTPTTWEQCAAHVEAGGVVEVEDAPGVWINDRAAATIYRGRCGTPDDSWVPRRLVPIETEATGVERYLAGRLDDPEYAEAYRKERGAIDVPDGYEAVWLPSETVDEFDAGEDDRVSRGHVVAGAREAQARRGTTPASPPAPSPVPPWPGAVLSGLTDEDGVPTWLAQAEQVRGEQVRLRHLDDEWATWATLDGDEWVEVRAPRAVPEPETERVPWWAAVGRWTTGDELIVEVARTSVVPVVTVEGGGRVRVAPDGTVEVLARDGDQ